MMKTTIVLFGITGDLSRRKLLPVLGDALQAGRLRDVSVVGVSRRSLDVPELLREALGSDALAHLFSGFTMDLAAPEDYVRLRESLDLSQQIVIYLSVPPGAAAQIVDFLGEAGLTAPHVKILFEKPFGYDRVSADEFIARTARYYRDEQIYRIDHYAAKEVALRILELRSDASQHHHAWSNQTVLSVEVVASETLGIEGRGEFYEQTGALRDVVQGHLMQLLALVLLRVPADFSFAQLPVLRYDALRQIRPADPARARRAQYEGYKDEVGNTKSQTETFVSLELESDDAAWRGVPLRLTTGKALDQKRTSVVVTYIDGTADVFDEDDLRVSADAPRDAYERVFIEAITSNRNIFTSGSEVLESWRILAPLQAAWGMGEVPLYYYPKNSSQNTINSVE